jgi:hypothetical protein
MKKIFTLIFALGMFIFAGAVDLNKFNYRPNGERVLIMKCQISNLGLVGEQPKFAPAAEQANKPVEGFTTAEIAWYPSESQVGQIFNEVFLYNENDEENGIPQAMFYIYTEKVGELVGSFSTASGTIIQQWGGLAIPSAKAPGYEVFNMTDLQSATLKIEEASETELTFSGSFVKSKALTYTFSFTTDDINFSDAEHTYEPMAPQTLPEITISSGEIDMSKAADSIIYVDFVAADETLIQLVYYHTDEKATEMPNGEFEILDEKGSFLSGLYYYNSDIEQGYPVLSYALVPDGEYVTPYYLYSGTIKVSGEGNDKKKFEVDVLSFYGTPFKFTYDFAGDPQAIENTTVDTKAKKVVRDGQIFILRDGKMYNAIGTEVR